MHSIKRPGEGANEGKTPALGNAQARRLLEAPPEDTLKGKRDRAILATLLDHGLRREEFCELRVRDRQTRQGIPHFRVHGNGDKLHYLPINAHASQLIKAYLAAAGHGEDRSGALFRPIKNNRTKTLDKPLQPMRCTSSSAPMAQPPASRRKSTTYASTRQVQP